MGNVSTCISKMRHELDLEGSWGGLGRSESVWKAVMNTDMEGMPVCDPSTQEAKAGTQP